jgi:hypothetical protein
MEGFLHPHRIIFASANPKVEIFSESRLIVERERMGTDHQVINLVGVQQTEQLFQVVVHSNSPIG